MAKIEQIGEVSGFEVDPETEMALSVMDSGCFALSHAERIIFAVKGLLPSSASITARFVFEHIDKDEFPAVCVVIFIEAGAGLSFRHECFFSLESERDIQTLKLLARSKGADIWFFDSGNLAKRGFTSEFDRSERDQIASALASVRDKGRQGF